MLREFGTEQSVYGLPRNDPQIRPYPDGRILQYQVDTRTNFAKIQPLSSIDRIFWTVRKSKAKIRKHAKQEGAAGEQIVKMSGAAIEEEIRLAKVREKGAVGEQIVKMSCATIEEEIRLAKVRMG